MVMQTVKAMSSKQFSHEDRLIEQKSRRDTLTYGLRSRFIWQRTSDMRWVILYHLDVRNLFQTLQLIENIELAFTEAASDK